MGYYSGILLCLLHGNAVAEVEAARAGEMCMLLHVAVLLSTFPISQCPGRLLVRKQMGDL